MSHVSLKMICIQVSFESLNVVGLRLAAFQRMIPHCSLSITKWGFIAYSPITFVVPNSQQESNNKLVLASDLDNLIIEYMTHKNPLMKLRSCLFNRPNLLFAQIGKHAPYPETPWYIPSLLKCYFECQSSPISQICRWRTLSLLCPSAISTLLEPGLQ